MKTKLLFMFLLFALPTYAQTPFVQGGGHNYAPDADWQHYQSKYSWDFSSPLNAKGTGCTILVVVREPNWSVTDSQGNAFVRLETEAPMLWYSKTCFGGPDTIYITNTNAGQPDWVEFAIGEYAGMWVPKNISVPIANYCCSTNAWSTPIAADAGDLLIGIGANHTTDNPIITAGTGWVLRANYNAFFEDSVATTSGSVTSTATYSASTTWCQTTVSFTHPPFVWTMLGFGKFTFPMVAPPDCSAGDCTLIWNGPSVVTFLPGQSGTLVIRKPSGDTVVVTVGP